MKNVFLTLLMVMLANMLAAQMDVVLPTIRTGSDDGEPIELKRLNIDVFVADNIATTTFEMQFYNNNDRVMEGALNFPLNEGVTVSRFALEVNGKMREGVVIEKEQATQAFEAVTRRNIDPGIVEATKGNNFRARVYPIPAKGYKKATIAFEKELTGDNDNYIYQLPLNFKEELEEFSVKVEVVKNKPQPAKRGHPSINLHFSEERNSYIGEYNKKNVLLDSQLAFSIPKPEKVHEVLTYEGEVTSDNYFYINLNLDEEYRTKSKPSKIAIIWDESLSGKTRDIEKELKILESYLTWMKDGAIELKTFSNTLHTHKEFRVKEGKCPELIDFLKSTQYDGGTNLGSIDFNSIKSEEILLFTDGISTFGEIPADNFNSPVISINSSKTADHNLLRFFASASNGVYANAFNLTKKDVLNLLQHQQKRFIKAEYDPQNITDFYPETGTVIAGDFSCAGKAEGAENEIQLHFGFGDNITESHTVLIDNSKRIENSLGERIWAQKKLKHLLVEGDNEKIKEHGKKYSLVTPGTSLIVLDRVQDYVRHEVTPPESLQNEYNRLISQKRKENAQQKQNRLNSLCNQFKADVEWWKTSGEYKTQDNTKSDVNSPSPPPASSQEIRVVDNDVEIEDELVLEETQADQNTEASVEAFAAVEEEEVVVRSASAPSGTQENPDGMPVLSSSVNIKKYESDASYMNEIKATNANDLYKKYLTLKPDNSNNPSFYFDVASYMFQKLRRDNGLRVISNLAELEMENTEMMRTLGRKLSEHQFYEEAIAVFKEVMNLRSFEPHSYIDLGLTYAEMGEYQKAIDNLYAVIEKDWDSDIIFRFSGIELIVLHDINNIMYHHREEIDISNINECFIKHMPVDVRVVIDWDANETDIDLWVIDPRGEKCFYKNNKTQIGGKLSNDITQGYGPEEFRLKNAIEGKYAVDVNFYGSRKQTLLRNITVRAIVYTNFGSDNEDKKILTLQLEPNKEGEYTVGELMFE